jgi:hypothetical protein
MAADVTLQAFIDTVVQGGEVVGVATGITPRQIARVAGSRVLAIKAPQSAERKEHALAASLLQTLDGSLPPENATAQEVWEQVKLRVGESAAITVIEDADRLDSHAMQEANQFLPTLILLGGQRLVERSCDLLL